MPKLVIAKKNDNGKISETRIVSLYVYLALDPMPRKACSFECDL